MKRPTASPGVQLFELEGIIQHFPVMLNYTMGTPVIKV